MSGIKKLKRCLHSSGGIEKVHTAGRNPVCCYAINSHDTFRRMELCSNVQLSALSPTCLHK